MTPGRGGTRGGLDPWLVMLCVSRTFNMFIFMTYAATLPVLRPAWGMSAGVQWSLQ